MGPWGACSTLGPGCRLGTAEVRASPPLAPSTRVWVLSPMLPKPRGLPHPRIPAGEIQGLLSLCPPNPRGLKCKEHGGSSRRLGPCPSRAHVVPTRQLGFGTKDLLSPVTSSCYHTPSHSCATKYLSPFLGNQTSCLIPRRQRPTGKRQPRVESRGAGA